MKTQVRKTNGKATKSPKLVGVYVRPREEHWGELLGSVDSAQAALDEGRFVPEQVRLPKPRILPVYQTGDGQRVFLEETPDGFVTKPYTGGPLLEIVATGGIAGGFLSAKNAPPLPLAAGMNAADWAQGYMSRVPERVDLNTLQDRWGPSTQRYSKAVAARTAPEQDEWRRLYFSRIREAAAARDPIYQSPTAAPKGPRHFTKEPAWGAEEYHGGLFKEYGQAAAKARDDSASARTAAPEGVVDHSPLARMLALGAAIQKNGAGLPALFHQALEPEVSARMGKALLAHLRQQAQAQGGNGAAMEKLRGALDILKKLNEAGGGQLLAAMLGDLAQRNGKGTDLDKLMGDFIQNLAQMGLNQGLEEIMGKEAAGLLAGAGVTDLLVDAAKDLLMGEKAGLADGAEKLLAELPNKLIDMAFDKLLGQVDDRSSMARQLLAKYRDKIKELLKKLISPGGLEDLQKQWDAIWKSVPSKATVKFGLAIGFCAPDLVMVNGRPVTRVNDECIYPPDEPPGKFFQGNPTITVNGAWPSGHIHAAINPKGTIATPEEVSSNVLMGEATVSVKVQVQTEAPGSEGRAGHGSNDATCPTKKGQGPDGSELTEQQRNEILDDDRQRAVAMTEAAIDKLRRAKVTCDPLVAEWFGIDPSDPRYNDLIDELIKKYEDIRNFLRTERRFGYDPALTENVARSNVRPYPLPGYTNVGPSYFTHNENARAETNVHEAAHRATGAKDYGYVGPGGASDMRHFNGCKPIRLSGEEMRENADSLSNFAQQAYGEAPKR